MQSKHSHFGFSGAARTALTGLLVSLILFVATLAASPALHKWLHADADRSNHECLITLFAKGQVSVADAAPVTVVFVAAGFALVALAEVSVQSAFDFRFSPSRAPPAA